MGGGNSQESTSKTQWKQTGTNRRVPPNSYNSYPGIYPPATNEYPPYYSNYPPNYHGNHYQNQYYPQQQMMPNGYETVKQTHHQQNDHSSHRHHKHHKHHHDHHHHPPRVRNQQQQTQQNSREFAAQTTPTLFLGDNPDEIPRSTPALLRESSSMESLDEKSLNDEVNPIPLNPSKKPPSVPPPKSSSSKVVVKKILSPKVTEQQQKPSPAANLPRSTPAVPQKPATPVLNPWPNSNGWPAYNQNHPTIIPNMIRNQ